ncbi:MAG: BON domain-containing protein [Thermoguttaceae bacterium]
MNTIAKTAKERISRVPHLTLQRIWCEYEAGTLFLRGQVPSFYYKQLAQEAVNGLEQVHAVANEIEVVW